MASLLNILARSIEKQYVEQANESDSWFGEILRYINTNIIDQERLRIPVLSERFGISADILFRILQETSWREPCRLRRGEVNFGFGWIRGFVESCSGGNWKI